MYSRLLIITLFSILLLHAQEKEEIVFSKGTLTLVSEANVGDQLTYNGEQYLVVDNQLLRDYVNQGGDLSRLITTKVTDMSFLFYNQKKINGTLSFWDTSNVTTMAKMFCWTENIDPNVINWDTSKVIDFGDMFRGNKKFNKDINHWDVSQGISFAGMFHDTNFNQNINAWDVSNAKNLSGMFDEAIYFNQPLDKWDVSGAENLAGMFAEAIRFNQDISKWDVSSVRIMRNMFRNAAAFKQNLSLWNTKKIKKRPIDFSLNADFVEPQWEGVRPVLWICLSGLALLFLIGVVLYRKKSLKHFNQEAVLLKHLKELKKDSLNREELDCFLDIQDKSIDAQKRQRSLFINSINKSKSIFITRERCPTDARTYRYKISKR